MAEEDEAEKRMLNANDMQWLHPETVRRQVRDRLAGRFKLIVNEDIGWEPKIVMLAAEPEVF